ncbi:MAG: hypothetical protein ACOYY2_12920 [Actinomycetota bacterium]
MRFHPDNPKTIPDHPRTLAAAEARAARGDRRPAWLQALDTLTPTVVVQTPAGATNRAGRRAWRRQMQAEVTARALAAREQVRRRSRSEARKARKTSLREAS